jgi:hypothetical protein
MRFLRLLLLITPAFATTYYVDSNQGDDAGAGAALETPWKTLAKVNATEFKPGDRVLFKAGCRWRGQLAPRSSGSEGSPIVFDRYGDGRRPHIDGAGQVQDAVRLYNVQHIEIRNLEITNYGPAPAARTGVHISAENTGTAKHIIVSDLYIHDVNGTNQKKDTGGIIFRTNGDRIPTRFDGLVIERNIVWRVDRSGIAAQSYHWPRTKWYPSLNVVIRDNLVDDIGGDGIVPWATEAVLVEHNIARNCNRRAATYNAGIWPWSADNSVFQLNEAALTRTTMDGQGFDSDYNSRNTLFQYNYSHDNEGGFMLICSPGKRDPKENIGNIGTVVRYNISRNDHARIFHLSAVDHTLVHDNVIYVGPGIDVQMVIMTDWTGWANDAVFRNNRFYVRGIARYGHQVSRDEDGSYGIGPGWGPAQGIVFEHNRYAGRHVDPPSDFGAVKEELSSVREPDWNVPTFDPANPANFREFLARHRQWMLRLFEQQFGTPVKLGR